MISDDQILSFSDGDEYKDLVNSRPDHRLVTLQLSCDGVPLGGSLKRQMNPLFIKMNELNVHEADKIVLYGVHVGVQKANLDFLLEKLVVELNDLNDSGIEIERLNGEIVYPVLLNCVFDTPARSAALNHQSHTGFSACTICKVKGETYRATSGNRRSHKTIFLPTRSRIYKTKSMYRGLQNKLKRARLNGRNHYRGIFGESMLNKIRHTDCFQMCIPDAMHALFCSGFAHRFLLNQFKAKFRSSICSLYRKEAVINERIKKFGSMQKFKRTALAIEHRGSFKASQVLMWFFYVSPIALRGLLNEEGYGYWMLLVYAISNFWSGLPRDELDFNHNLIRVVLEDLECIFSKSEFTFNSHLLLHIKNTVKRYGPLSFNNLFIYEDGNRSCKSLIQSPHGQGKQILNQYKLAFNLKLKKKYQLDSSETDRLKLKHPFNVDGDQFYRRVIVGKRLYTSWSADVKKQRQNSIVKLISGEFFLIDCYFLNDENELCMCGQRFEILENLDFEYGRIHLKIDYIYRVKLLTGLVGLRFEEVVDKVHLVKEFYRNSSEQLDDNIFYLIDVKHVHHN